VHNNKKSNKIHHCRSGRTIAHSKQVNFIIDYLKLYKLLQLTKLLALNNLHRPADMVYEQEPCTSEIGQNDLTERRLVHQSLLTYLKTRKRQLTHYVS
jgi:hypothetical protein